MNQTLHAITGEVEKVIVGKRAVIEKVLMAMLAGGHVLLDDVPGVGKTSLAVALGKALGLKCRRVQFTPDVLPSDIVGFSMYDKRTETFHYVPGAASDANLLLGDEINRTSSKTQSALLEAMEEGQVTVDGVVHKLEKPFCVIATQNQVGTVGTQPLPQAQMDRFLVRLTMGYPDLESQMALIRDRQTEDPMNRVARISDREGFLRMQAQARDVTMKEELIAYIARLSQASREHPSVQLGLSPRGALALSRMAKASAYLRGRDYVIVEDVQTVAQDVCAHRLVLTPKARLDKVTPSQIVAELLARVPVPNGLK